MNNSSACDIDFSADQIFFPVLYGCVFCIGLPANCLALYSLYRLVKADNALPVYVINLLLTDLLQIITLPLWMDYYSRGHQWRFGDAACGICSCILGICLIVSISFMCCVACERYLAVVHPLRFQRQRRLKTTYVLCLAVWTFALSGILAAYLIGFGPDKRKLCFEHYPRDPRYVIYRLVMFPLTFIPPLSLLVFVFFQVRLALASTPFMSDKEKKRVNLLLLAVMVIFILVFGPYHVVGFIVYTGTSLAKSRCVYESKMFIFMQVSGGMLSLNVVMDPILYIFLRNDVTEELDSAPCCLRLLGLVNYLMGPRAKQGDRETSYVTS